MNYRKKKGDQRTEIYRLTTEMLICGSPPARMYEVGDVSSTLILNLSLIGQVCEVDGISPALLLNS